MKRAHPSRSVTRHIGMHLQGTARTDARVLREATALVRAGYAVTIVDTDPDVTRPQVETLDGVTLRHIPKMRRRILPGKLGTAINVWRHLPARIRALLALQADAYHAHDANTLFATYIVARIRRRPLILDAHELPYFEPHLQTRPIQRWFYRTRLRRMLPGCRAVITVSPPIVDEMRQRYGGPRAILVRNVPVYYPSVSDNSRLHERLCLPPETRIALYQGYLKENRSLDVLVRAARFLPSTLVLVLMGNGASKAGLEALIAAEGVGERVRLLDAVPYAELLAWTASADLGLIIFSPDASLNVRYSLPNKLFEYLMAGLPVLASELPAVNEILNRYGVGATVSTLDPEAVAHAITAMLADSAGLAEMRRRALGASAGELNWDSEQSQLIGLYRRILDANSDNTADALSHDAAARGAREHAPSISD
jgi:glycosyltransferase involved in cell wall biosynthesis